MQILAQKGRGKEKGYWLTSTSTTPAGSSVGGKVTRTPGWLFSDQLRGVCVSSFKRQFTYSLYCAFHPKCAILTFLRPFPAALGVCRVQTIKIQVKSRLPVTSEFQINGEYFCSVSISQILHGTYLYDRIICSVCSVC